MKNKKKNDMNLNFEKKQRINWLLFFNPFNYNKIGLNLSQLLMLFFLFNLLLIGLFAFVKFPVIKDSLNEINSQFFGQLNNSITIKVNSLSEDSVESSLSLSVT